MNVRDAIEQYILWRRSLGAKLATESSYLRHFLKCVDGGVGCDEVTPEQVRAFIAGAGPLTRTRSGKYSALACFYRYAISRGYATRWPLPGNEPRRPPVAPPYVYSREEVRRLLDGLERHARHARQVDADTLRTLILLLYGAGLRGGEARRLLNRPAQRTDFVHGLLHHAGAAQGRRGNPRGGLADTARPVGVRHAGRPWAVVGSWQWPSTRMQP